MVESLMTAAAADGEDNPEENRKYGKTDKDKDTSHCSCILKEAVIARVLISGGDV